MFVKLFNGAKDIYVNPEYVTSILPADPPQYGARVPTNKSKIWIVGHAGYGTYSETVDGSPDEVARKLSGISGKGVSSDEHQR